MGGHRVAFCKNRSETSSQPRIVSPVREASGEANPAHIFDFQPPGLLGNKCVFFQATQTRVFYYGILTKLMQQLSSKHFTEV